MAKKKSPRPVTQAQKRRARLTHLAIEKAQKTLDLRIRAHRNVLKAMNSFKA
jgi:hypothetical protein